MCQPNQKPFWLIQLDILRVNFPGVTWKLRADVEPTLSMSEILGTCSGLRILIKLEAPSRFCAEITQDCHPLVGRPLVSCVSSSASAALSEASLKNELVRRALDIPTYTALCGQAYDDGPFGVLYCTKEPDHEGPCCDENFEEQPEEEES